MDEPEDAGGAGTHEEGGERDGHRHLHGYTHKRARGTVFRLVWVPFILNIRYMLDLRITQRKNPMILMEFICTFTKYIFQAGEYKLYVY